MAALSLARAPRVAPGEPLSARRALCGSASALTCAAPPAPTRTGRALRLVRAHRAAQPPCASPARAAPHAHASAAARALTPPCAQAVRAKEAPNKYKAGTGSFVPWADPMVQRAFQLSDKVTGACPRYG